MTEHSDSDLALKGDDLADAELYATERPEQIWAQLRRLRRPVLLPGQLPHWAVTSHAHIREVLQHSAHLSSEQGNHLGDKPTDRAAAAAAAGLSLLVSDGERHAAMRKVLATAFRPRLLRRLTERTQILAHRLVGAALTQPTVDFVETVAVPLPAEVVCALLGVPSDDTAYVVSLSSTAFGGATSTPLEQLSAHAKLFDYCDRLLTAKRSHPDDDVASILASATIDGAPMPRQMAIMNCHDLIAGGNETARHTLSAAVLTAVGESEFWHTLRGGGIDLSVAAEEMLRFETPVSHLLRVARADLDIAGLTIPAGAAVTLWLRSGNRDETAFTDADSLHATRRPNPHLAFGHGPHYCIAAELGRIEVQSVLKALVDLVSDVELVCPPRRLRSTFFRGYEQVVVALS